MNNDDKQIHLFIELLQLADKIKRNNYTEEELTLYTNLYNEYYGIQAKTSNGLGK